MGSGIHEARIPASLIDVPASISSRQMDFWAREFDSWDVCDQCCSNLFGKTAYAERKAVEWSARKQEFVKRVGFTLMAASAVHYREAPNSQFLRFLRIIKEQSDDDRNFVKKSVNWALRQIGKRNARLNKSAIATAEEIRRRDSKYRSVSARRLERDPSDRICVDLTLSIRLPGTG